MKRFLKLIILFNVINVNNLIVIMKNNVNIVQMN